ncbi:MAG: carboxypeptidase regulatory-like domain-containing protein [Gammaproteobacteria bacterium]|nr:carboxypeptidase regulatory-like domain-containing protein [Gammaproteobacteria bacterium]
MLATASAVAETIVKGRVIDASTDAPVIGAEVELLRAAEVLAVGDSDNSGRFLLSFAFETTPEQRALRLRVKRAGYATGSAKVIVTAGRPDRDAYDVTMLPDALARCVSGDPYLVTVGRFFDPPSGANVVQLSGYLARALSLHLAPELQKKHLPDGLQLTFVECTGASPHSLAHLANYARALGAQVFIAGDVIETGARYTVRTYFGDPYGVFGPDTSVVNRDVDIADPAAVALDADTYAHMLVALTHRYVENGRHAECVDICVAAEQLIQELSPGQPTPKIISDQREFCAARTENARLLP